MDSVCEIVRGAENNFLHGNTKLGKYVNFQMHDTIETIDAYLNSKHITGDKDALSRDKPFFNIVTAAVNIWYRATDLDRKNIKFIPQDNDSVILATVANVLLQRWMDANNFGQFLNLWGRALARYGSAVVKFVEKDGDLIPAVVPWNRFIADPVDFDAIPHIEKLFFTPAQLRQNAMYDQTAVDDLITALQDRKTLDNLAQDNAPDFIEVYEVHGMMDTRLLQQEPDLTIEGNKVKYAQQMHVVSFVQNKDEYEDFTLYKGKEARDPYMITHLIPEDGRTLSIGAVEYLFDAQWMTNHSVKNMKDTLDLASKLIFQTADTLFAGRNVLSAIETGDILIHQVNMPLERIANDKPDITALQGFQNMWERMGQEITSTPDAVRGVTLPSSTAYRQAALLAQAANSFFEIMTENKGLSLEDILRAFVIPHLKKQLKNTDQVSAMLDDMGVKQIDSLFLPQEAIKQYNGRTVDQLFANASKVAGGKLAGPLPPFDAQAEQQNVQQGAAPLGNQRFFKPDELSKKTWAEIFSDFEWEDVKVEITQENSDKQAVLQTLSTVLQSIATNPAILQDPNARMVFNSILNQTGTVSPLQLSVAQAATPSPQQPAAAAAPPLTAAPENVLPARGRAAALIG